MKTTELVVCCSCLVVALISTFGEASPGWRPQGRFGKRTHMAALPRVVETAGGDEIMMPSVMESQAMYQNTDLGRLCADSRYAQLPECAGSKAPLSSSSSRLRSLKTLADYFNL